MALCDEKTSSDGEAFIAGFQENGLGTVIGVRTWGGEIWLSRDNRLVDGGIASAPEMGGEFASRVYTHLRDSLLLTR